MPVFRCEGGPLPLDGKDARKEDIQWGIVLLETIPFDRYQEMVSRYPNGNVASVWAVTHRYEYESRGPKTGVWKYLGSTW